MSNLRERAAEVKERGIEERDNWTPPETANKIYNYWLDNTKSSKGRAIRRGERNENFCHFWRVVAIWAPLRAIGNTFEIWGAIIVAVVMLFAAGAFVYGLIAVDGFWLDVLKGAGLIALGGANIAGIFGGASLVMNETERDNADFPSFKPSLIMALLGPAGAVFGATLTAGIKGYLHYLSRWNKQIGLTLAGLLVAGFYATVGFSGGLGWLAVALGGTVVGVGLVAAVIAFCVWVSDYVSGKRKVAAEKREEFYEQWGKYPEQAEKEARDSKPPTRFDLWLSSVFKGLGDLAIFVAQVVRVKKWGICPLVDIDAEKANA